MTAASKRDGDDCVWNERSSSIGVDVLLGASAFYYLTSLVVLAGVLFAMELIPLCREHPGSATRIDVVSALAAWDGEWYLRIARSGYTYDAKERSSVAFFPLYPLLAAALMHTTGVRPEWALLIVSHAALIAAMSVMMAYVRRRFPAESSHLADYALLAMGLFPTTFYFRMAYTESLFLLLTLLALYGMERRWHPLWLALIIGLATASRTVGVALVPVLAFYLWQSGGGARRFVVRCAWLLPLSCGGLARTSAISGSRLASRWRSSRRKCIGANAP